MRAKIAHRRRHPDIRLVKNATRRPGHKRPLGDAAAGQRHIGGDDNIVLTRMIGDPVVRGVETSGNNDVFHHGITRWAQTGIGNKGHFQPMSFRHLENLRLHGAGIGIDIDLRLLRHGHSFRIIPATLLSANAAITKPVIAEMGFDAE